MTCVMYYVLDTNICDLLRAEHPTVLAHLRSLSLDAKVVASVVTFGESIGGWLPLCRRAATGAARAAAYESLYQALEFYLKIKVLPFTKAAGMIFDQLRARDKRIGTNDLAIAAITLSVNGILVTRNFVDFSRVSGLGLEDWTK